MSKDTSEALAVSNGERAIAITDTEIQKAPAKVFLKLSAAELERRVALYPEGVREDTIWVQGFLREHCNNNIELLRSVAEKFGHRLSKAYFYNAITGHSYRVGVGKGDPKYWREVVAALREHDRLSTNTGKLGFVETPTYRCFASFIDEIRAPGAPCKFGLIVGPTGSQKTACRKYYRLLNNHGKVVSFEASRRRSIAGFQRKLAEQYNAKIGNKATVLEAALRDNLNETKTIIVDNAQRLYWRDGGNEQPIFDYLLELQEDTGCTVILIVTEDFVKGSLEQGAAKNYFEQLVGRFGGMSDILRLPDYTPDSDLKCIARAYGLKDDGTAFQFLRNWSREQGRIRIMFKRLIRARNFAKLDGRDRITIADLQEANDYVPPSIAPDVEGGES